jgi:murein DD-endopeptidase MepM/ murein hydrolase activator NlpD
MPIDANTIGSLSDLAVQNALNTKAEAAVAGAANKNLLQRQQVAQEFASLLYLEVLKAMRAALPRDGLLEPDSSARDIYTNMMDAQIARLMAKRDTTGLTKMVEKSLDKAAGKNQNQNEMATPTDGTISSNFGVRRDPISGLTKFHEGIDIAAPAGDSIKTPLAGRVISSSTVAGYGNMVEVDHGDGLVTRYAHNSVNLVAPGDEVQAGQSIALIGNTGHSTGPHLHFEVRKGGKPVDPRILLGNVAKGTKHKSVA